MVNSVLISAEIVAVEGFFSGKRIKRNLSNKIARALFGFLLFRIVCMHCAFSGRVFAIFFIILKIHTLQRRAASGERREEN